MQNISCDNQIYLFENNKIIFISLASHVASLSNRGLVQLGNDLLATLRLRDRRGRNGCLSALWDWRQIRMKARTRRKKWSYRRLMYWVESFLSQRNIAQCQFWTDGYLVEEQKFPESDWRSWSKGVTVWFEPSSETGGQSVGPGEKARRTFSSTVGKAPRYRLSPNHKRSSECQLLIGHRKWFESFSLVLFVSSYTTAIISPQLPCSFTKLS